MKTYQTNSALGHNELAFFVEIDEDSYMCIGHQFINYDCGYDLEHLYNFEPYEISESSFEITESPLYNKFSEFLQEGLFGNFKDLETEFKKSKSGYTYLNWLEVTLMESRSANRKIFKSFVKKSKENDKLVKQIENGKT